MGSLYWQLNDCWPVVSWSLIDYYLRPKASYYFVKRAFSPVLVSLDKRDEKISIYIVNDKPSELEGVLEFGVQDVQGNTLYSTKLNIKIPPNASITALSEEMNKLPVKDYSACYIYARLFIDDRPVSEDALFLDEWRYIKLHKPKFEFTIEQVDAEGHKFQIIVKSDKYARAVRLKLKGVEAEYSDNYFDLFPNVPKSVTVKTRVPLAKEEIQHRLHVTSIIPRRNI